MKRLYAAACLAGLIGAALTARADPPCAAASGSTFTFPYKQRQFLYSRDGPGGLAYVPSGAPKGAKLPVVVFLHGMNPNGLVHMWFGPPQGDLRPVVDAVLARGKAMPFILVAPTHTRYATGATVMWHDLDLGDFLDATARALDGAAQLDRGRVVVVGHSGGGCNPSGGIFAKSVAAAKPLAVLAIDTCVDAETLPAITDLASQTPVRFYWQRTWARPIESLSRACPTCAIEEITDLAANGHEDILPEALRRALPAVLPAGSSSR